MRTKVAGKDEKIESRAWTMGGEGMGRFVYNRTEEAPRSRAIIVYLANETQPYDDTRLPPPYNHEHIVEGV